MSGPFASVDVQPVEVTVVRPRHRGLTALGDMLFYLVGASVFIYALAPFVTDGVWAPTFWQSMGAYVLVQAFLSDGVHRLWTKGPTR